MSFSLKSITHGKDFGFRLALGRLVIFYFFSMLFVQYGETRLFNFSFNSLTAPVRRAMRFVRGLFPACYSRTMHCCDHYGRPVSAMPVFTLNARHLKALARNDWGDGADSWHRISFRQYVLWRLDLKKRGAYCDYL
jgi:hypothetical protein